jgi:hypothetical protein
MILALAFSGDQVMLSLMYTAKIYDQCFFGGPQTQNDHLQVQLFKICKMGKTASN